MSGFAGLTSEILVQTAIRFVVSGAMVSVLFLVAKLSGPTWGGTLIQFPALGLISFYIMWQTLGKEAVFPGAMGALAGIAGLTLFYVVLAYVSQRYGMWPTFGASTGAWLLVVLAINSAGLRERIIGACVGALGGLLALADKPMANTTGLVVALVSGVAAITLVSPTRIIEPILLLVVTTVAWVVSGIGLSRPKYGRIHD